MCSSPPSCALACFLVASPLPATCLPSRPPMHLPHPNKSPLPPPTINLCPSVLPPPSPFNRAPTHAICRCGRAHSIDSNHSYVVQCYLLSAFLPTHPVTYVPCLASLLCSESVACPFELAITPKGCEVGTHVQALTSLGHETKISVGWGQWHRRKREIYLRGIVMHWV